MQHATDSTPSGPAPSSAALSAAEALFARFLEERDAGAGPELAALCEAHPAEAERLRELHARWERLDAALCAEFPAASDDGPATGLADLCRLGAGAARYELGDELGRGGMGRVLSVWDRDLERRAAMKILRSGRQADARSLRRFLAEARVTGRLEHPGIVPVHELGLDADGRVYFTMPLVRGEDLRAVFRHVREGQGGWTRTRALGVLVQVCETLGYAHDRGVVHRDVKPGNVMVGPFGETFVLDWGLARVIETGPEPAGGGMSADDSGRTTTLDGDVVGTPAYMAPEQAHGMLEAVGPRTDVYGVGALLYELLTGYPPFSTPGEATSSTELLDAVRSRVPRAVHTLAPDVPPELQAICERAMQRTPAERYEGPMAFAADLRAFLERRVVAAYETGAWAELRKWIARNRRLSQALGAALLLLVGGLATSSVLFLRARASERDARFQEGRADASAARLAAELRHSRMVQGRLAGAAGRLGEAEDLLWSAALADAEDTRARWILWELYARYPRLGAAAVPPWPHALVVTPDGTTALVSGGEDPTGAATLTLFGTRDLERRAELALGPGAHALAVRPDGALAVVGGPSGLLRTLAPDAPDALAPFARLEAGVGALAYLTAPDGRGAAARPAESVDAALLVGGSDGTTRLLDADGRVHATFEAAAAVTALVAGPGAGRFASGHADGSLRLWEVAQSSPRQTVRAHSRAIARLVLDARGDRLVASSMSAVVSVWDAADGQRLRELDLGNGNVRGMDAGPGVPFALGGWYRTDFVDPVSLTVVGSYPSALSVEGLARLPDGGLLTLHGGVLMRWDVEPVASRIVLGGMSGWLAAAYGDDGTLVLGDRTGRVRRFDVRAKADIDGWREAAEIRALAVRPGGGEVAVLLGDEVHVRDVASGTVRLRVAGGGGRTSQRVLFSPDGGLLATALRAGGSPVVLWEADDGARVAALGRAGEDVLGLAFDPAGARLFLVTRSGAEPVQEHWLSAWSPAGDELWRVGGGSSWEAAVSSSGAPWKIAVSCDGALLATGQWGRTPEVRDAATGSLVGRLKGHAGHARDVAWHPRDPYLVASVGADSTVRLWDARTSSPLMTLTAAGQPHLAWVAFGPYGETIAACGDGDAAYLWDLTYFDRHVAGNARYRLELLEPELREAPAARALAQWADDVLARPWPRFGR